MVLYVNEQEVKNNMEMSSLVDSLEKAFSSYYDGDTEMPEKSYLNTRKGDFRAMPAKVVTDEWEETGVKWVSVYPDNPKNIKTVIGTFILTDIDTGERKAIIEANNLTSYRTGAVSGLSSKYMAPKDTDTLGLLGLGVQSTYQAMAIETQFDLDEIIVSDLREEAEKNFKDQYDTDSNIRIIEDKEEFNECDVLCSTTPSKSPILESKHVKDVGHINAMGADSLGKKEYESEILKSRKVYVDDLEQAKHAGEVSTHIQEEEYDEKMISGTLGEILNDKKYQKQNKTFFDSTGLAIQDVTAAKVVYQNLDK